LQNREVENYIFQLQNLWGRTPKLDAEIFMRLLGTSRRNTFGAIPIWTQTM